MAKLVDQLRDYLRVQVHTVVYTAPRIVYLLGRESKVAALENTSQTPSCSTGVACVGCPHLRGLVHSKRYF